MIPTEDEAKDLIARGLWKNLLMMLIEEVITMVQVSEERADLPPVLIDEMRKQVKRLEEYLKMLGMYECFITVIFRRDMIYETLYKEVIEDHKWIGKTVLE